MSEAASLSIFFDGSLWVAVYTVAHPDGEVQVARHVFGAEPSAAELSAWVHDRGLALIERAHRAPRVASAGARRTQPVTNPKRLARAAAKEQARVSRSTASQDALKQSQRAVRHSSRRADRQADLAAKREKRRKLVEKRKAKRRGH